MFCTCIRHSFQRLSQLHFWDFPSDFVVLIIPFDCWQDSYLCHIYHCDPGELTFSNWFWDNHGLYHQSWWSSASFDMLNSHLCWSFFPKQCGHTEGVLTVRVKARCLIEVVSGGVRHFSCKFPQNGSCEMSMCVSTVQARTKRCAAGFAGSNFFPLDFHTEWLFLNVHVRFDCAGSHKVCSLVLGSVFLLNILPLHIIIFLLLLLNIHFIISLSSSPSHHHHHRHHHPHHPHHDHDHPYYSAVSFYPPTLFGVSCRDNCHFPLLVKSTFLSGRSHISIELDIFLGKIPGFFAVNLPPVPDREVAAAAGAGIAEVARRPARSGQAAGALCGDCGGYDGGGPWTYGRKDTEVRIAPFGGLAWQRCTVQTRRIENRECGLSSRVCHL